MNICRIFNYIQHLNKIHLSIYLSISLSIIQRDRYKDLNSSDFLPGFCRLRSADFGSVRQKPGKIQNYRFSAGFLPQKKIKLTAEIRKNPAETRKKFLPGLCRFFQNCQLGPANIFFQVSSGFLPGFLPFFCRSRHVIGMCERVLFCRVVAALPGFLPIFFRAEAYMTMSEGFRKKTRQNGRKTAAGNLPVHCRIRYFYFRNSSVHGRISVRSSGNGKKSAISRKLFQRSPIQVLTEPYVA